MRARKFLLLLGGRLSSASGSAAPLVNTVAPAITGTEEVGETLSVSDGTWTGAPSSYTYQWFRAITSLGVIVTSGGLFTGVAIGGATSNTYLLDAADEDELLYCEVTAVKVGVSSVMAQSNATGAITAPADAAETTAFLARTTGLDATHTNAYKALINDLVADGIFAKLDFLHVLATQDKTTAYLNLISTSFTVTESAPIDFVADDGISGNGATISTNFNPSTASSPKFTQNSACVFAWGEEVTQSNGGPIGSTVGNRIFLYVHQAGSNNAYFGINDPGTYSVNVAQTDGDGFYLANRSAAGAVQGYKNGSSVATGTPASVAPANGNINYLETDSLVWHVDNILRVGGGGQSLTAGEVGNLYTRLQTYLTAVGAI